MRSLAAFTVDVLHAAGAAASERWVRWWDAVDAAADVWMRDDE